MMHSLKIKSLGPTARGATVEIDGKAITGLTTFQIDMEVNGLKRVVLHLFVGDIEVEVDDEAAPPASGGDLTP